MTFSNLFFFYIYYFIIANIIFALEDSQDYNSFYEQEIEPSSYDRVEIHNELNRELRNALCCANKMRCCKKSPKSANLEIRAVLVRCPNTACEGSVLTRRYKKPIYSTREHDIKQFQGFDEDEPLSQSAITNCRKKLLLTIKVSDMGYNTLKNEYIVVDHVFDPVTRKNTRILTPYVIKLKQEPIMQMYGLKFLHVVNSRAREVVYNKHDANYTGCDTTSSHPTCGKITYNGKIIPYSQGFCCSCDALINSKRQPETLAEYAESVISYSDPAFLLDGVECPRNLKGRDNINEANDLMNDEEDKETKSIKFQNVFSRTIPILRKRKRKYYPVDIKRKDRKLLSGGLFERDVSESNLHDNLTDSLQNIYKMEKQYDSNNDNSYVHNVLRDFVKNKDQELDSEIKNLEDILKTNKRRTKRQVTSSGAQRRGGQNCADRYTPKGLDPESYHESTHCLRFSDLWYTVYHLQPPAIEHSILFQVFEKHEDMNGRTKWKDVTKGKMIRVGTMNRQYMDEKNTMSIRYYADPRHIGPTGFSLNYKSALLLVPEGVKKVDAEKHPEIRGGPGEYLVVHANQISVDGDQCNVAGVGFEAFVKQPNRCSKPRGTCLANQPYNLWRHDHEAEKLGKKGCFFLKHYGILPKDPIRKNLKTGEQYLVMEYVGTYASTVDLEIKADFNTVLRPQSSAKITEVYVDSTSPSVTLLTVKITNSGLTSSSFMARLSDCPLEMPASFNNIQSKPVLIPPQHQHVFHLEIKCSLPADRFHCSVEALNCKGELVALRRIRLQKFDRCICTWHCLCACVGSSEGLKCIPMSLQHYHAAGFQGSLPVTSYIVHYTFFDDVLSLLMYIFFFLILILLSLGLCKALIGLMCFPPVGIWGLDVILDLPKPMKKYYEAELAERKVHYDHEGWPVHPDTRQKVRSVSRLTEFCLNVIFFFAYPLNVIILLFKRVCCPQYVYDHKYPKTDFWYSDEMTQKPIDEDENTWSPDMFTDIYDDQYTSEVLSDTEIDDNPVAIEGLDSQVTEKGAQSVEEEGEEEEEEEAEPEQEEEQEEEQDEEQEEEEEEGEELDTIQEISEETDGGGHCPNMPSFAEEGEDDADAN